MCRLQLRIPNYKVCDHYSWSPQDWEKTSQGKEDQQHRHAAQWGQTCAYFEKPFHFSRNSTFPFTTLRSKTFSTTYSSSSSSSSAPPAAAAAAVAAAGAAAGAGSGADTAGCSSSSAFLPFFPAMVASLTSDEGTSGWTKSREIFLKTDSLML